MKTLVIGASTNPDRYSYKAVKRLLDKGMDVEAIGMKEGKIGPVTIKTDKFDTDGVDTVSLYVNPMIQESYYDYVVNLQPRRVIFNPGTENYEFIHKLKEEGIEAEVACTLVLLSTNQY
ncbi:CoA-binding protein [Neptunitalea lumnitzerae]|uniref:CoA-binding protein n=1 Tax=Neptunitalea lumnitzerae TaxID=2965509 RepID=A0ABQ5MHR5_9FLAO|nr:CoA-binding protein [Neptunitalea sp. Y10]GLB48966.1 CoA-binding protein [Neptunitalea sp. Y10]